MASVWCSGLSQPSPGPRQFLCFSRCQNRALRAPQIPARTAWSRSPPSSLRNWKCLWSTSPRRHHRFCSGDYCWQSIWVHRHAIKPAPTTAYMDTQHSPRASSVLPGVCSCSKYGYPLRVVGVRSTFSIRFGGI